MLFSELYKIIVDKATVVGFRWGDCPTPWIGPFSELCKYGCVTSTREASVLMHKIGDSRQTSTETVYLLGRHSHR